VDFARVRSILEVPILNPKFWGKVPEAAADAIMIDLEDSAPPDRKLAVRDAVLAALRDQDYFGGRRVIVRVNNLATPWGRDDLLALAASPGDFLVCYPKVESAAELAEVNTVLAHAGGGPRGLHVMIETAGALQHLDAIASSPGVRGLHFGYVDFASDVGSRPFSDDGADLYGPANHLARSAIAVAGAAYGLFVTGGTLIPDYKDLDKVRAFVRSWADLGYTACIALSPAHLDAINTEFAPSAEEVAAAQEVCAKYESALANGEPAAIVRGKVVTMPDYRIAQRVLARV
jgi:citrate lyase beta subunit